MIIKVNYTVSDVYMSTSISPVYIKVVYSGVSGGGGTWGTITGTLSAQTDLQAALDAKFDDPTGTTSQYLRGDGSLATFPTIPSITGLVPYTGATTNVDLGEFQLSAGQVTFDQTPTGTAGVGVMRWNDSDGTLDLGLKGGNVTLQVGQEQVIRVVNKSGVALNEAAYQVVKITDAQGQRLAVDLAQGNNDANSTDTIGIVTETIANNQEGFVTTSGIIRGINTTGSLQGETWVDGDVLYLSPTTAGAITKVKPTAPNHSVILGYVVYAHINNGKIFVKCDNGYELGELHDVYVPTPSNNDGIFWNTVNSRYQNNSIAGVLGYTPVTSARTLTINGTAFDLSADRSWTISSANIYTADGTLTGNRIVDLGGNKLMFHNLGINGNVRFNTNSTTNFGNQGNLMIGNPANNGALSFGLSTIFFNGVNGYHFTIATGLNDVTPTTFFQVRNSGRVLIGTTTESTYLLDVNGTARVISDMIINEQTIGKGLGNQSGNFAAGKGALKANTTGNFNTAIGSGDVLGANQTGTTNVAVGTSVLNQSTGSANTGIGSGAFLNITSGDKNIAIGTDAARALPSTSPLTSATESIFIGRSSTAPANGQTNQIVIGHSATGLGSNTTIIGNSSTITTALRGRLLLGTTTDSGLYQLDVNGTARVSGVITLTGGTGGTNSSIYGSSGNGVVIYAGIGTTTDFLLTNRGGGTEISIVNGTGLSLASCLVDGIRVGGTSIVNQSISRNGTIGLTISGISTATTFQVSLVPSGGTNGLFVDANANIKIGAFNSTYNASAILEAVSTTKGFLPPRMTTTQRDAISTPATGLVIYNSTLNSTDTYDGARWRNDADTTTTNRQTASYSLVLADRGKLVEMNSASANTLTVPLNSSIAFPIGSKIDVTQYGAGATTITAASGVTIRSFTSFLKIAGQYAACTLVKIGTDEWYCYGNLIA